MWWSVILGTVSPMLSGFISEVVCAYREVKAHTIPIMKNMIFFMVICFGELKK
jgi:hypothetical protein